MAIISRSRIDPLEGLCLERLVGFAFAEWVVTEDPYLRVTDLPRAVAVAVSTNPTTALKKLALRSAIAATKAVNV